MLTGTIMLMTAGCHRHKDYSVYRKPVKVETMQTGAVETIATNTYMGKVAEGTSLSLRFPLGGKVTNVYVHKNQHVRQGDKLATIDDTQQQNALKTAKATLSQAQDGYDRLRKVYEQGAVAEVKWVEIQTQLQKAQAMVSAAEQRVADCVIHAPQNGIIEECDLSKGQQLLPTQTAIRLINTEGVVVSFAVPEKEISSVHTGDEAEILIPALDDKQLSGSISEKSMTGNILTHSYEAKIALRNKGGELIPGMICKVRLKKDKREGIVIPADCVQTRQDGLSVWIVEDGIAHKREIQTARFVEGGVLVEEGLQAGETIVTKGYQKLWEGAEVSL